MFIGVRNPQLLIQYCGACRAIDLIRPGPGATGADLTRHLEVGIERRHPIVAKLGYIQMTRMTSWGWDKTGSLNHHAHRVGADAVGDPDQRHEAKTCPGSRIAWLWVSPAERSQGLRALQLTRIIASHDLGQPKARPRHHNEFSVP